MGQEELIMNSEIADAIPLAKQEKRSHKKCLIIFITFIILYFGIAANALSYKKPVTHEIQNETSEIKDKNSSMFFNINITAIDDVSVKVMYQFLRTDELNFFNVLINCFRRSGVNIFLFVCATLVTSAYLLPMTYKNPKLSLKICAVMECIFFLQTMYSLFYFFINIHELNSATILCLLILKIFSYWDYSGELNVFFDLKFKLISEVIKESYRAICASLYLMLLSFISSTLMYLVTILTYIVLITLKITDTTGLKQWHLIIFQCINLICGCWLVFFIMRISQIICARTFIIWFYSTNKYTFPNSTIAESIVISFRYHLGTAAYASSLWGFLISIIAMIKNIASSSRKQLVNKTRETRYNIFLLILCYWTTYNKLFVGSSVIIAMEGKNFKKSLDSVCWTYLKHPLELYAINKGFGWCISIPGMILTVICAFIYGMGYSLENISEYDVLNFSICILFCMLPAIMLIETAIFTITLCIFKEVEYKKQNQARPNFMNATLKNLFIPEE